MIKCSILSRWLTTKGMLVKFTLGKCFYAAAAREALGLCFYFLRPFRLLSRLLSVPWELGYISFASQKFQ